MVFPTGIGAVRLFGPQPRPGELLACDVRVRELTERTFVADLELRSADGSVWALIEGWATRRFATDDVVWDAQWLRPSTVTLGEPQDGGWCLARPRWDDRASQEMVMRRYLVAPERVDYEHRNPRAQGPWLLGRIAAKDAARHWLWTHGHGALFPGEVRMGNDAEGRPWIEGPGGEALSVSLSHSGELGVALVRPPGEGLPGIDIEALTSVAAASGAVRGVALTPAERQRWQLLADAAPDTAAIWLARFWTAKEAVGKAEGTGLAGRPHDLEVVGGDADCLIVSVQGRKRYRVATRLVAAVDGGPRREPTHVVAWTLGAAQPEEQTTEPGAPARRTE
jgi:phosphopantetheinyl transferase